MRTARIREFRRWRVRAVGQSLSPPRGVPLSIDERKPRPFHFEIGQKLTPLRDEGVLIVGSGNLVHNLESYARGRHPHGPYDWALRFENVANELILAGDLQPLIDYESLGPDAALAIPTPDRYLPLLYILAAGQPSKRVQFPVDGVDGGPISMLAVQIG